MWTDRKGNPPPWKVEEGVMVSAKSDIQTKEQFGDLQLHVEFREPTPPKGEGQGRGNSGVFLMGRYEIQVLDCYQNKTYADGATAGIYGQHPPLVNACLPPGEWQTYDIHFQRAAFQSVRRTAFARLRNGAPQWSGGAKSPGHPRRDQLEKPRQIHAARSDGPHRAAISQQRRGLPQYLGAPDHGGRGTVMRDA